MKSKELKVSVDDKEIIHNITFDVPEGKVTVLMGPNGSGKSSIANALMGHPSYSVTGSVNLGSENILELEADERSKAGLFLSFQYPTSIEGVPVKQFLRQAVNAHRDSPIRISEFKRELAKNMELLKIPEEFAQRYVNTGFSGGEKKKMEILQLLMLKPKIAILDETDSGLDVDALKQVCEGINIARKVNPDMGILLITHYNRILQYIDADRVIILKSGNIVKEGGKELVDTIEAEGFENI